MGKLDIQELQQRKEYSRKARRPYERDWWMNLAFINGEQYVTYSIEANRLVEVDAPPGAVRTVHNICMPIVRTERAKILKTLPNVVAVPSTQADEDMMMAKALSAKLRDWKRKWKLDRRVRSGSYWIAGTGNVFFKWYWDMYESDVCMAVVPPFDAFPDPYAKNMVDCRWFIQQQFLDMETAKERYGTSKLKETATEQLTSLESRIYSNYADGADQNLPGVVVNEYWEKPSKTRPKGAFVVYSEQDILYSGPFPYEHGHLPYTHVGHIERANSKWYASMMDFVRGPQIELNRVESQIVENRNMASGKWYIPSTLELESDPDASPRQILRASGGSPELEPKFIEIQALPQWVANEPTRITEFARDMAGQHEVSQGGVPGRVEAAQAIQLLQETDDEVLKDTIHSLEEALAEGGWQALSLLRQYGSEQQIVNVYDKDGAIEVQQFMRTDMPGPDDLHVVTQTTTGLPTSIAGKWDRVLNLWQYKVLQDPNKVLELLDMAPEDPDLVPELDAKKQAWRENQRLYAGYPEPARKVNNHAVHLDEHKREMNSEKYRQLTPEQQSYFEYHVEMHEKLWLEVLAEEAQRQMTMQGQPAAPPPAEGDAGGPPPPPAQENGSPAPVG